MASKSISIWSPTQFLLRREAPATKDSPEWVGRENIFITLWAKTILRWISYGQGVEEVIDHSTELTASNGKRFNFPQQVQFQMSWFAVYERILAIFLEKLTYIGRILLQFVRNLKLHPVAENCARIAESCARVASSFFCFFHPQFAASAQI